MIFHSFQICQSLITSLLTASCKLRLQLLVREKRKMNKIYKNKNAKVFRILNGILCSCYLKIFHGSAQARRFIAGVVELRRSLSCMHAFLVHACMRLWVHAWPRLWMHACMIACVLTCMLSCVLACMHEFDIRCNNWGRLFQINCNESTKYAIENSLPRSI